MSAGKKGFVLLTTLVFLLVLTALVLASVERGLLEQKMVRLFQWHVEHEQEGLH